MEDKSTATWVYENPLLWISCPCKQKSVHSFLRQLINPEAEIAEKITESVEEMMLRLTGIDLSLCPEYGKGKIILIEELLTPVNGKISQDSF
ncbi:MAG: hypothetical protein GQ541_05395 [Desulfovibrionaceae bacterium]|nr:hypothetical protein [Desulfovibrionaceae bacterium]